MLAWRMGIFRTGIVSIILVCSSSELLSQASTNTELLDARQWNFSKRFPLNGNWSFFDNQLLSLQELEDETLPGYIFFPSLWNDFRDDKKGIGYATYAVGVLVPDSFKILALEIPQLYSCYKLWVNGNLVSTAGSIGINKEAVVPKWVYQKVSFPNPKDTIKIVLQIANFNHHKGGAKDPIYLGTPKIINAHYNWAVGVNVAGAIILFLEGLLFFLVYHRKRKRVILYFSLLCLTWSLRSVCSNLYPVVLLVPEMNWELLVKIEYITLYLTAIWASLFFFYLFKDMSNVIFTYLPIALNIFFILFTLLTPAINFSQWVTLYLGVEFLVILYGASMIIRALIMDREGSWFLIASLGIGILLFGYDMAAYQSSFSYDIVLLSIGYVIIFTLTATALLYHLSVFKRKNVQNAYLTYNDLFNPNKK